ncbi:hypothetical protein GNP80_19710 [Aliivibrio fischeri]|uniref:hypothetical protein n=1 Tax=Aliivibrio fischeri TaxID=668 RepID=UPI0012DA183F|nr:hypothetical protein [Aliivibrio fischeri]MUK94644.1 hypothetical protein [Aliivibrio fischeri]
MHFNCKLIPSSSLSHKELEYILTPDEYIRLLSREKNSQNIINQLPVQLRQSLSISASKSVQSLLFSLNQKLTKAEWIAVSTTVRKTGVSDTQLAQYPQLKKQIDRVETTQPAKFVKANFKPVTDDVPLVRNLSFTPVEPSPEHKISIEFAGQWPNNAASLLLAKSGEQKEKITKPRADIHASHRSIATFKDLEPEPRNLYLTIPMNGTPQPLKLLIAENIQPVDKETEMDEWDTVLVPVKALAYLTSEQNKLNAAELQGGYVYLFWKGVLWREFYIDNNGYYQDIDVEYHRRIFDEEKNKSKPKTLKREPDGLPLAQFWVPYKIAGEVQQGENGLKIIFSPKQKRFAQIEALESDAALLEKSSTPLDELSSYSDAQSFSAQEFTSDVDSAVIHKVTEDDMPWLSDQQAVLRSYDQSNTVIAYVDGKNSGFLLSVETGLIDFNTPVIHYAVISDSESDWVLSEALQYDQENPHFATAQLGGFPPKGKFTLQITSPGYAHHSELVFQDLTLEQIQNWPTPNQMAERVEPEPERSEQELNAEDNLSQYMSLWKQELGM